MWSPLQSVPLDHDEHVSMCDLHLVYLGFGAFLCLVPRPAVDIKEQELPILGHVIGEDPNTNMELIKKAPYQISGFLKCSQSTDTRRISSCLQTIECFSNQAK